MVRYLDSGSRDPSQALGTWLSEQLDASVGSLRIQSGFFSVDALPTIDSALQRLCENQGTIDLVVGSNDGGTVSRHLSALIEAMQMPRAGSRLAIVYYKGSYFHPKTYHLGRADGSQAAYVGSANFTMPGVSARHVEAGLVLDTRQGDSPDILNQIATASQDWFNGTRVGVEIIGGPADVERLLVEGLIRSNPAPRVAAAAGAGGKLPQRPTLAPLFVPPPLKGPANDVAPDAISPETAPAAIYLPSIQRTPPYPPYMQFSPDDEGVTRGIEALSGSGLGTAVGLIMRLSRDNDRHWREAPGTANISIPVSTASTLRFGLFGPRSRPRAEFGLRLRHIDDQGTIGPVDGETNVMSFGFTPGDVGHQDLRMVLPRPPIAEMRRRLIATGRPLPKAGDLALLEWPITGDPTFRLTTLKPDSELGKKVAEIWGAATAAGETVSRGACWMPQAVSPEW